eukprot:1372-Heterococcus_DN1.PRE.3
MDIDGDTMKRFREASEFGAAMRSCLQGQNLRSILENVGAGSFLFIAGVSKGWKQSYEAVDGCTTSDPRCLWQGRTINLAQTTLVSAVFASPARIQLAATGDAALCLENWRVQILAGLHGNLAALKAALQLGLQLDEPLFLKGVVRAGHLAALIWVCGKKRVYPFENIMEDAAMSGNVELLMWLRSCRCAFSPATSFTAAKAGHLPAVMYLFSNYVCDAQTCNGHLPILQWLVLNGCPWNTSTFTNAAVKRNDVPMLAWVKEQGVVFNAKTMKADAEKGHLAVCQYLRAEQCEWDVTACFWAAYGNHIDTLRWLHENGCPWPVGAICVRAASLGYLNVLQYLY